MDYPSWYRRISAPFRSAGAALALGALDRGLVILIAVGYASALIVLAGSADGRFWKALLVPAATFAIATVLRAALDRPRPYAVHDINPILKKDKVGKSFPSRHVASAVAIACAMLWLDPLWGALALVASAVVAATRIIGGVHFPRDVAGAAALSAACALAGFALIP